LNARPRVGAAFLNSVSRTALAALSLGLGLGVVLPGEARAGCTVSPVQSFTYPLICNPTTFGSSTDISVAAGTGVYGLKGFCGYQTGIFLGDHLYPKIQGMGFFRRLKRAKAFASMLPGLRQTDMK
jgi:hypothetical protein